MSNIEPTEEQKQAAREFMGGTADTDRAMWLSSGALARLLAEREAKLRAELHTEKLVAEKALAARNEMENERDNLRAYLAKTESALDIYVANDEKADELLKRAGYDDTTNVVPRLAALVDEVVARRAKIADAVFSCPGCGRHDFGFFTSQIKAACGPCRTRAEAAEVREAQHLADIKALRVDLSDAYDELYAVVRYDAGENYGGPYNVDNAELVRAQLARRILATAHYDDAKAGAPATCPKCTDDARPVGDGERWVCSVCRRPCRVPLNDAEGGEG